MQTSSAEFPIRTPLRRDAGFDFLSLPTTGIQAAWEKQLKGLSNQVAHVVFSAGSAVKGVCYEVGCDLDLVLRCGYTVTRIQDFIDSEPSPEEKDNG